MEYFNLNEFLKPCPFCGAYPVANFGVAIFAGYEKSFNAIIKCPKCNIEKKYSSDRFVTNIPFEKVLSLMDTAIYNWNTRNYDWTTRAEE